MSQQRMLWARGLSPVQSSREFLFDPGTGLKPRAHSQIEARNLTQGRSQ